MHRVSQFLRFPFHSIIFREFQGQRVTRSTRANLNFPVGRVQRKLRNGDYTKRVGAAAPIFIAAVLENLVAEILTSASAKATADRVSFRGDLSDPIPLICLFFPEDAHRASSDPVRRPRRRRAQPSLQGRHHRRGRSPAEHRRRAARAAEGEEEEGHGRRRRVSRKKKNGGRTDGRRSTIS